MNQFKGYENKIENVDAEEILSTYLISKFNYMVCVTKEPQDIYRLNDHLRIGGISTSLRRKNQEETRRDIEASSQG